jgi:spore maturation protein CgeB
MKNPAKAKLAVPTLKNIAVELSSKPRYMVRARVWEALWCRTFLLEEDNPVTSLYFRPYVDYVPFTTPKDLVDKIRYYLENDEERDRIRLQGRATVQKYYNARVFCENLFETTGIQSSGQNQHRPGEIWNKAYFDKWYSSHPPQYRDSWT